MWLTWKRHRNNMPLYLPDYHFQEELPAEEITLHIVNGHAKCTLR
jgi:hypothetical protein